MLCARAGVLAQFPVLRVVARTSSFYFKNKPADARSIARQLGVSMLLEGSVRISGSRLRVAAQLIEASTAFHIWADQFERPRDDLLDIQSSIAYAISHALEVRFSTDPATAVRRVYGGDPEAYRLWLRGRYHLNRLSPDAIGLAIESFQRALDRDPEMAPAWGGIAQCCAWLGSIGGRPVAEAVVRAKRAISQALAIDEATADAHLCLGMLAMGFDYDWAAAERECRRTLELNPAHSEARILYAGMLGAIGRSVEGHAQITQAHEQDPASASVVCGVAADHVFAGRYDEALRALDRALALQPELPVIYYWLALVYLIRADYEQLETICRRVFLPHLTAGFLGCCCARTGRRDEACRILRELETPGRGPSRAYQAAVLQLGLDNPLAAIACLDQARQCGCFGVLWLAKDPLWTALRETPGFTAVLQKMNLA